MTFGFHFMENRVALTMRVQRAEIKRALPIVTSIIFCNGKSYYDIYCYCDRNPDSAVQCDARHRESTALKKNHLSNAHKLEEQKQHSARRLFISKLDLNSRRKLVKWCWKLGSSGKQSLNTL
jgi:hypothetical protein